MADLTQTFERTLEVYPRSGACPTHTEILEALARHQGDIRDGARFIADVAAELRADQYHIDINGAEQPVGAPAIDRSVEVQPLVAGPPPETDWRDIQRRLLEKCDHGERFTTFEKLSDQLGCSPATTHKAVKDSDTLRDWQKPHLKTKPKVTGLNEIITDSTTQVKEPDPANVLPDHDIDRAFQHLLEDAEPDERARLHELQPDERRALATVYFDQNRDVEPSPLADDPPGSKPKKVIEHKKL